MQILEEIQTLDTLKLDKSSKMSTIIVIADFKLLFHLSRQVSYHEGPLIFDHSISNFYSVFAPEEQTGPLNVASSSRPH